MTPTMKKILKSWLLAAALCFCVTAAAERPMLIHSHNDYCRRAPFWQAYAQGVYSIEADVFLHDGLLLLIRLQDHRYTTLFPVWVILYGCSSSNRQPVSSYSVLSPSRTSSTRSKTACRPLGPV